MKIPFPKNFKPQKPLIINDHQDMMVTIYCLQIQPQQFNLDKLREKKIISIDHKLIKPIIRRNNFLQFFFNSGIILTIELGKVSFYSKINENIYQLIELITKFTNNYHRYNWQKIRIHIKRFISFPHTKKKKEKFFPDNFLKSPQNWDILGKQPSKIQLNFFYKFPNHPLFLSINEIAVKLKNKSKNGLLFRGIFSYNLITKKPFEKNIYLNSIVRNYENNLKIFNTIIDQNILS